MKEAVMMIEIMDLVISGKLMTRILKKRVHQMIGKNDK